MNLFQSGRFRLHSGEVSSWKIECDALSDADWDTIAGMVVERYPVFGAVIGVPRGGWPVAARLVPHVTRSSDLLLIVDDVLTTGASMEEVRARSVSPGGIQGVVVFARGPCPAWVAPICSFWSPPT